MNTCSARKCRLYLLSLPVGIHNASTVCAVAAAGLSKATDSSLGSSEASAEEPAE